MEEGLPKTDDDRSTVLSFLRRCAHAAGQLARDASVETDVSHDNDVSQDPSYFLNLIAGYLLAASNPAILNQSIAHLPSMQSSSSRIEILQDDDDENNQETRREICRADYLRQLLRILAPIAMDVSAAICSNVAPENDCVLQMLVLYSQWLPIAPHLTPMITELFVSLHSSQINVNSANLVVTARAACNLSKFFVDRRDVSTLLKLLDWSFIFGMLIDPQQRVVDDAMDVDEDSAKKIKPNTVQEIARWYAARTLCNLMDWSPVKRLEYLRLRQVDYQIVPWELHPWIIDQEEETIQRMRFQGFARLWDAEEFLLPSSASIRMTLPTHSLLATIGNQIPIYPKDAIKHSSDSSSNRNEVPKHHTKKLVHTKTSTENLTLLGVAMCQQPYPPPLLVCGINGSGKSSLVKELNHLCRPNEQLLEIHVDEETDSKTLIGSYTTTDIPGEFSWRPGALTRATRSGQWVLLEDVDSVPVEIQAALVKLLEKRLVPLGNGKYEQCHPNFRLFGTCTTSTLQQQHDDDGQRSLRIGSHRSGGKRILNPSLWRKIHVNPLPPSELKEVATTIFKDLPETIIDSCLKLMRQYEPVADDSSRTDESEELSEQPDGESSTWVGGFQSLGRQPTVRDLFKLLSRIAHGISFEVNTSYATEEQRTNCLAESVDVFIGSCPDKEVKHEFITQVAAPVWGVSAGAALSHTENRRPDTHMSSDFIRVGRVHLDVKVADEFSRKISESFSQTSHSLRMMESIGVCIRENEPALLVGETGCGKTTLVQELAGYCGRELIVQNLSLQTDSTDLLGGYKPLEIHNIAGKAYRDFVEIFVSTFSRKQNSQFLDYASSMKEKKKWKKLSQCFVKASQLGLAKVQELAKKMDKVKKEIPSAEKWVEFKKMADTFERQRLACDSGLAFVFSEGALVDAIRNGKWVLLDEINLASSETLQRLCGLLDNSFGSITLTERGDAMAVSRHEDFRLFAAMNPATDAGKKDLQASIRSRFSEIYVHDLLDPVELRCIAATYLSGILPVDDKPPEHTDIVIAVVDLYLQCRNLAETILVDGGGHKPRYTLRSLARALKATKTLVIQQKIPLRRALYEGFQLSFEGCLDEASTKIVRKGIRVLIKDVYSKTELDQPGRRPGGRNGSTNFALLKPFWITTGPVECVDWAEASESGRARFILTASALSNLRRLACAIAAGPWSILLEGPTSAGKTTLVEYIAARCGHQVVRINNHEHTDVQEYTGSFSADSKGSLSFRDGILVKALRRGYWVILDELNLAPSEVLEALNRLLDDNRELYLAETNETVKPHKNFRLFATQNPSGVYGGRKPLSRAFRNRFVELHMGDIPSSEMVTILEKRCGCPPSHAKKLVDVMVTLRYRRSKSSVFLGKDSLITPRDLLRWAERDITTKLDLVQEGYMLLAERLRTEEEKSLVQEVLEDIFKSKLHIAELYYGELSESKKLLDQYLQMSSTSGDEFMASIAPTRSLLRLIALVTRCVRQKEPVLLVGDTGCGKTTVVQFLSFVYKQTLLAVNCHATTETSDLLGGLRPVRGRDLIAKRLLHKLKYLLSNWPYKEQLRDVRIPEELKQHFGSSGEPNLEVEDMETDHDSSDAIGLELRSSDIKMMLEISKAILIARPANADDAKSAQQANRKRRKIEGTASPISASDDDDNFSENVSLEHLEAVGREIETLGSRFSALFEWSDGPLVTAMRTGHMLLLDEMSLAEDAVLERLNSVLEPSRTLVLAEKSGDSSSEQHFEDRVIKAHDSFRIFATMNPGGDFGKRELSPALRSRFTEIWVPAVTHASDIGIVLSRTIDPGLAGVSDSQNVVPCMLDYINWFNGVLCKDSSSPFTDLKLSLRDILSWAHFMVEAMQRCAGLSLWHTYCHGACLMHLDGLGLGSGLGLEDAATARDKAKSFLEQQIPDNQQSPFQTTALQFGSNGLHQFGSDPFYIKMGSEPISGSVFNLHAPTTARNIFRVLRGMQVRKPILLEGSPGVGKTSLVTALASASGHKLVRINLSEQTDISDLMGNDLPVQDSESSGASFRWCDGVLLTAIKEGSWVLLDELNLASQSVLEGLNSCLDHRANVYIPELGMTFACPPTFRIFAAQNPLAQGGGRKGLPKSFLNRFTKVYVDALDVSDLRAIVACQYPEIDTELSNELIDFNAAVHRSVVDERGFGEAGSPWEFNLRDVFRLCDLIMKMGRKPEDYIRDLYYQRFRTTADRNKLALVYQTTFKSKLCTAKPIRVTTTDANVKVGDVVLVRKKGVDSNMFAPKTTEQSIPLSLMQPMEAISRCIALQWPCLIVGGAGSGKSATIASLAELCNINLIDHCMSPSSDVTELIGCFEQVDKNEHEIDVISCLVDLSVSLLHQTDSMTSSQRLWQLHHSLVQALHSMEEASEGVLGKKSPTLVACVELTNILETELRRNSNFKTAHGDKVVVVSKQIEDLKRGDTSKADNGSHFIWRDGVLVKAMMEGQWLHLENVNLCPSSVLDRLNSVLEKDGELLLSECGTQNESSGQTAYKIIRPHPDFRIFLSMNAANGEISRAMRNRCVEIALVPPVQVERSQATSASLMSQPAKVEALGVSWDGGIRSQTLGNFIQASFLSECERSLQSGEETPCAKGFLYAASLFNGMLQKGLDGRSASQFLLQIFLEVKADIASTLVHKQLDSAITPNAVDSLPTNSLVRSEWCMDTELARIRWEARLLRLFLPAQYRHQEGASQILKCKLMTDTFQQIGELDLSDDDQSILDIQKFLFELYLTRTNFEDFLARVAAVDNIEGFDAFRDEAKSMAPIVQTLYTRRQTSGESSDSCSGKVQHHVRDHPLSSLLFGQLYQNIFERDWYRSIEQRGRTEADPTRGVLEMSFQLHEGKCERSTASCTVTPMVYPFFAALDESIQQLTESLFSEPHADISSSIESLKGLICERNRLWHCVQKSPYLHERGSFVSFDEAEFLVQWKWFKRSFAVIRCIFETSVNFRKMIVWVETIDMGFFGTSQPTTGMNNVRKRMGGPKVPQSKALASMIHDIRAVANEYSTYDKSQGVHSQDISVEPVELDRLLDDVHPAFFMEAKDKFELLSALCTAHWATTNETQSIQTSGRARVFGKQTSASFKTMLESKRKLFASKLDALKVDTQILTVENQMSMEQMEELRDSPALQLDDSWQNMSTTILQSFAMVQLSPIAEMWCVIEERYILQNLQMICIDDGSLELKKMLPSLRQFIRVVVANTVWVVTDLRPFQSLVWAIEGDLSGRELRQLLKCLLPIMLCQHSNHLWSNSFSDLDTISNCLEIPCMWSDEKKPTADFKKSASSSDCSVVYGPHRVDRMVRTEAILRLLGHQFVHTFRHYSNKLHSLENNGARMYQSKALVRLLSSLPDSENHLEHYGIMYQLADALSALQQYFDDSCVYDDLLGIVTNHERLRNTGLEVIKQMALRCSFDAFTGIIDTLLLPLLSKLKCIIPSDSKRETQTIDLAWARVYLGLLRLQFLVPDSPLDPGRAPLAKVAIMKRAIRHTNLKKATTRFESGFIVGCFDPNIPILAELDQQKEKLTVKCKSQERKVVERPDDAPPFYDLFREMRDFTVGLASAENVLTLVEAIATNQPSANAAKNREDHWQGTAGAVCDRLQNHFSAFEDISVPIAEAIRCIQNGIRGIRNVHLEDKPCATTESVFDYFLQFPVGYYDQQMSTRAAFVASHIQTLVESKKNDDYDCQKYILIATLSQLVCEKRVFGQSVSFARACSAVFNTIASNHIKHITAPGEEKMDLLDDEEILFREAFPNHFKEFNDLLKSDAEDMDSDDDESTGEDEEDTDRRKFRFDDEQLSLISTLHHEIYSSNANGSNGANDSIRRRAFWTSYGAASELEKATHCTRSMSKQNEKPSSHVMALSLAMATNKEIFDVEATQNRGYEEWVDFHNDPWPTEATEATPILQCLISRVKQLLSAFPGHPILLSLGKVCERVLKYDLLTTPIGKVMIGLEVTLRQAQDWEQHASERVKLGGSLQSIGHLVAKWRKLELKSWSRLLDARQRRSAKKARRYWVRLYSVTILNDSPAPSSNSNQTALISPVDCNRYPSDTPKWVSKGMSEILTNLLPTLDGGFAVELTEYVKILDTFVLTASLGEIKERLSTLEVFANQTLTEYLCGNSADTWRLIQSRVLNSIVAYYKQYLPYLTSKHDAMRQPIEDRMKDEVKLAKWDEQSYYSLADSTEKNHRKLMKILSEYDEILGLNVGLLLQLESCSGLRAKVETYDEMCATMPTQTSMFPFSQPESPSKGSTRRQNSIRKTSRKWTDTNLVQLVSTNKHVCSMEKYARKMLKIVKANSMLVSPEDDQTGSAVACELSDSIFGRLDTLRKKSTRPMKERALVDLFRELKNHGFKSMKWGIPNEVRALVNLFQLPMPQSTKLSRGHASILDQAESYYERCLSESKSFRAETTHLGSKYISRREMDIMVNLCDHMLFMMTQQRSVIANAVTNQNNLAYLIATLEDGSSTIPTGQDVLFVHMGQFNKDLSSMKEALNQLTLLLSSCKTVVESSEHGDWLRDTSVKVQSFREMKEFELCFAKAHDLQHNLVTSQQVDKVRTAIPKLNEIAHILLESFEECNRLRCLPVDSFKTCMAAVTKAQDSAKLCVFDHSKTKQTGPDIIPDFTESLKRSIENTLIAAQGLNRELDPQPSAATAELQEQGEEDTDSNEFTLWEYHKHITKQWSSANLERLSQSLDSVLQVLRTLHNDNATPKRKRQACVELTCDLHSLASLVADMSDSCLGKHLFFYRSVGKLNYILLRVFRTLVSKGYCSDKTSEDEEGDADGDISGMKFEDDNDGTGMGEGDGKKDVTDQLEDEEQILGLKDDTDNKEEQAQQPESKELNEEEADKGMEMEGDFEGELFDVPDKEDDENNPKDEDDEEELDREMGDDKNANEEVVDEKMWDESDDEGDNNQEEEKFEKDSAMQGEAVEGETRTKEEEEGNDEKKPEENPASHQDDGGKMNDDENDDENKEEEVNNDFEDDYEDQHGVDVRETEGDDGDDKLDDDGKDEADLDLDDGLDLDGGADDDDGDGEGDDAEEAAKGEEEEDAPQEGDEEDGSKTEERIAEENDGEEEEEHEESAENAAQPSGGGAINMEINEDEEENGQGEEDDDDEEDASPIDIQNQNPGMEESHGVKAKDGKDAIIDEGEGEDEEEEEKADETANDDAMEDGGTGNAEMDPADDNGGGGGGYSESQGAMDDSEDKQQKQDQSEIPNPFKNPGDANKFWHRKLNVVGSDQADGQNEEENNNANEDDDPIEEGELDVGGKDFEFTEAEQDTSTQVLGEAAEEQAVQMQRRQEEEEPDKDDENYADPKQTPEQPEKSPAEQNQKQKGKKMEQPQPDKNSDIPGEDDMSVEDEMSTKDEEDANENDENESVGSNDSDDAMAKNTVVADMSRLNVDSSDPTLQHERTKIVQDEQVTGISSEEMAEARAHWLQIQGDTYALSRRLCEKLRLVMEPLVASKLRGDYRTGKRINMKRVIGYIASGYRKDKIWLRRTKPAKRNYRVLVAVDDSESMVKSGAGEMALRAMATLAVGMNQLEIGELGVASFGNEMRLLHPFHLPFTSESGVEVVRNFKFDQQRTRTSLCVESSLAALDMPGENASMQLVFMISDGRIERDSRAELKRLIREMVERNILLAMIIVEGSNDSGDDNKKKKKDNIVNMKEVSFVKGKPVVKRFIEDYPFPYYMILDDMTALPEVLGDALKQWYEMIMQLHGSSSS